jgi:hypothetical protein
MHERPDDAKAQQRENERRERGQDVDAAADRGVDGQGEEGKDEHEGHDEDSASHQ